MSLKRWNARRDANEPAIVAALERAGALTLKLDVFDRLVYFRRQLFMLDVKMAQGRPTLAQERLIAAGWPLTMVETEIEALKAIGIAL